MIGADPMNLVAQAGDLRCGKESENFTDTLCFILWWYYHPPLAAG